MEGNDIAPQYSAHGDQPSLSQVPLDDVLYQFVEAAVVYNCAGREARLARCKILDFVPDILLEMPGHPTSIGTGSKWEGMPGHVCSDDDRMFVPPSCRVVICAIPVEKSQFTQGWFKAEMVKDNPAFLRLRSSHNEELVTASIIGGYMQRDAYLGNFVDKGSCVHGPAVTHSNLQSLPGFDMRDLVPCLFSPRWPPCTVEFFSRPRPHGWPSQQLLSDIQQAGCHVVAKASPGSEQPYMEFRWSSSIAEKKLFHSMDDNMAACMYLLKSIKTKQWEDEENPGICSYFLKMACFWTFEQNEPSSSILSLTASALDWLIMCYNMHNLRNYFIPNQNLIGHIPAHICEAVSNVLRQIKQDLAVRAFSCLQLDKALRDVVHSMATEAHLPVGDPVARVDPTLVLCQLSSSDTGPSMLQAAIRTISVGGTLYAKRNAKCMIKELDMTRNEVYERVGKMADQHAMKPDELPERVVDPILYRLRSVTSGSLNTNMKTCIHLAMGDVYLDMILKFTGKQWLEEGSTDCLLSASPREPTSRTGGRSVTMVPSESIFFCEGLSEDNMLKAFANIWKYLAVQGLLGLAEHYYRLACVPLESPDGSTDGGFVGKVNLAAFLYMTEQWDTLGEMVEDLETCLNGNHMGEFGMMLAKLPLSSMWTTMHAVAMLSNSPLFKEAWDKADNMHLSHSTRVSVWLLCTWALKQGDLRLIERLLNGPWKWCAWILLNSYLDNMIHNRSGIMGIIGVNGIGASELSNVLDISAGELMYCDRIVVPFNEDFARLFGMPFELMNYEEIVERVANAKMIFEAFGLREAQPYIEQLAVTLWNNLPCKSTVKGFPEKKLIHTLSLVVGCIIEAADDEFDEALPSMSDEDIKTVLIQLISHLAITQIDQIIISDALCTAFREVLGRMISKVLGFSEDPLKAEDIFITIDILREANKHSEPQTRDLVEGILTSESFANVYRSIVSTWLVSEKTRSSIPDPDIAIFDPTDGILTRAAKTCILHLYYSLRGANSLLNEPDFANIPGIIISAFRHRWSQYVRHLHNMSPPVSSEDLKASAIVIAVECFKYFGLPTANLVFDNPLIDKHVEEITNKIAERFPEGSLQIGTGDNALGRLMLEFLLAAVESESECDVTLPSVSDYSLASALRLFIHGLVVELSAFGLTIVEPDLDQTPDDLAAAFRHFIGTMFRRDLGSPEAYSTNNESFMLAEWNMNLKMVIYLSSDPSNLVGGENSLSRGGYDNMPSYQDVPLD